MILLDHLLTLIHTVLVLFIISGWAFRRTRKIHLIVVGVTLFAWLVIGFVMGTIGYCPLTDWHWDVKRSLGEYDLPSSFIKYMVDRIFNINSGKLFVDAVTGLGMFMSVVLTITVNFRRNNSLVNR